jgi:hypothetical protein
MSKVDYNVDNYTISELFAILELEEPATSDEIIEQTDMYIEQFSNEGRSDLVSFFEDIQTKLLQYTETSNNEEYNPNEQQTEDWIKYETLPQDDSVQKDKNTDRMQKVDVYDNNHMPMNRQQLGVNNTVDVPVAQDSLNPNLKNITSRFIVIDSQYRQASGGSESSSTDFTMDLSDPLTDVLSLRFYSIQIPYTWYTIDYTYGNTCFWVTNKEISFRISVEPGNYTSSTFCTALNTSFSTAGFTYSSSPAPAITTYNSSNGKVSLNLNGWKDPSGATIVSIVQYTDTFDHTKNAYFTFFDIFGEKSCYENGTYPCSSGSNTFDNTLGWLMGFRLPLQPVFSGGNTPQSIINLYGTKYFIIVLDDYNQNHINNGLISITQLSKTLPLPSYFNASQPYICTSIFPSTYDIDALGNLSNITDAEAVALGINPENIFSLLQENSNFDASQIAQVLASAPRTLTQAQIYTINEIIKNRNKTLSFRSKPPNNSDTFAIIPIKYNGLSTGQLYTELSGQFQDNKRNYFGPVDIDRLRIRLLNDKGNTVNLHGADWSITIISENLYQY